MQIGYVRITPGVQQELSRMPVLFNSLARLSKKQIRISPCLYQHLLAGNINPGLFSICLERINTACDTNPLTHEMLMAQLGSMRNDGIDLRGLVSQEYAKMRGGNYLRLNDFFKVIEEEGQKIIAVDDDLKVKDIEYEEETP